MLVSVKKVGLGQNKIGEFFVGLSRIVFCSQSEKKCMRGGWFLRTKFYSLKHFFKKLDFLDFSTIYFAYVHAFSSCLWLEGSDITDQLCPNLITVNN